MKKLFLCVGAAKTGTTWLYRNIAANPALHFTPEKELNYHFSRHGWFNRLTTEIRDRKIADYIRRASPATADFDRTLAWYRRFAEDPVDPAWYRRLFDGMEEGRWAADFSPSTSLIPAAAWAEVAGFAPETRIVYILREPEERLWSHAKFHAKFIGRLDEFRAMSHAAQQRFIDRYSLAVDGDYGDHLAAIYGHFRRDQALVLDYAEIAADPVAVLRRVEAFIGAPETPDPDGRLARRVNVSEPIPKPAGFGDLHRERFRRQTRLLVELGVDFALPWADAHAAAPARRRPFWSRKPPR